MKCREEQAWRKLHQSTIWRGELYDLLWKEIHMVQFSSHFLYNFQFEQEVAMLQYCLRTYDSVLVK